MSEFKPPAYKVGDGVSKRDLNYLLSAGYLRDKGVSDEVIEWFHDLTPTQRESLLSEFVYQPEGIFDKLAKGVNDLWGTSGNTYDIEGIYDNLKGLNDLAAHWDTYDTSTAPTLLDFFNKNYSSVSEAYKDIVGDYGLTVKDANGNDVLYNDFDSYLSALGVSGIKDYEDYVDIINDDAGPYNYDALEAQALAAQDDIINAIGDNISLQRGLLGDIDTEISDMTDQYNDSLRYQRDMYNRQASNLLSNQYLANAQTADTLQSDMRRARQNALEAGASAGIRLANNVNTLLTAQNKQASTAMQTSNALAEMLLQQRSAEAGLRSNYRSERASANARKDSIVSNIGALGVQRANANAEKTNITNRYSQQVLDTISKLQGLDSAAYNEAFNKWGAMDSSYNSRQNSFNSTINAHSNALAAREADRYNWEEAVASLEGNSTWGKQYSNWRHNGYLTNP